MGEAPKDRDVTESESESGRREEISPPRRQDAKGSELPSSGVLAPLVVYKIRVRLLHDHDQFTFHVSLPTRYVPSVRVRPRDVSSACVLFVLLCSTRVHAADLRGAPRPNAQRKDNVAAQVERLIGRPLADVTAVDFEVEVRRAPDASWLLAVQSRLPQER